MTHSTLQSTEGVNQQEDDNWPALLFFSKLLLLGYLEIPADVFRHQV